MTGQCDAVSRLGTPQPWTCSSSSASCPCSPPSSSSHSSTSSTCSSGKRCPSLDVLLKTILDYRVEKTAFKNCDSAQRSIFFTILCRPELVAGLMRQNCLATTKDSPFVGPGCHLSLTMLLYSYGNV